MLLAAGCATKPPVATVLPPLKPVATAAVAKAGLISSATAPPPPTTVTLTWQPNYLDTPPTNMVEVTFIVATTNLALPRMQWQTVFIGATNQCVLPNGKAFEFFSAFNALVNSAAQAGQTP